ncbi:MAG: hypothetical protein DSO07_09045 [Thermoproteota archaeon]|uniref:ATPase AAA-type core domain-containing protein n=1 Tax=Candidatus Methanodesulfokora washburnensis TaxID=2478471 RepID=A0A3R9PWJ6_9CREN|nr:ATP-binding protein [Candidatus Methanodesulfokores washburnensis]RSN74956.1 hypothetical protein D6D85_07165 [Candidatus Methanodesulfokores washburnensis]RZN63506.1 MAG: hypothetical protein EF810_00795 [Candidatus Methanodesulfokores washburnensis]TDA40492.1 MAG: hypothetical protein DSO07_09045 [Candidatus Korarchaeota archaeon]
MISSISISNFRGIKSGRIDGLTNINVLIGANGAGKSTVLEAIYLASAWAEYRDQVRNFTKFDVVARRRTQRGNWEISKSFLWYGMNTDEDINISLNFKSNKIMEFKIPYQVRPLLEQRWIFLRSNDKYVTPEGYLLAETAVTLGMEGIYNEFREEIGYLRGVTLVDSMIYSNIELIERNIWPKIYGKRLDKNLISLIKEGYEPDADSITYVPVSPNEYALMVGFSDKAVRIDDLGDGARVSLVIASVLSTVSNTAALIEDPEVHQHPAGLEKLLNFVLKVADSNNIQLFITTQSLDFLRTLLFIYPSNCKIFALRRDNEGNLGCRQFTLDEIEDLLESKVDIRRVVEELQLEAR